MGEARKAGLGDSDELPGSDASDDEYDDGREYGVTWWRLNESSSSGDSRFGVSFGVATAAFLVTVADGDRRDFGACALASTSGDVGAPVRWCAIIKCFVCFANSSAVVNDSGKKAGGDGLSSSGGTALNVLTKCFSNSLLRSIAAKAVDLSMCVVGDPSFPRLLGSASACSCSTSIVENGRPS